MKKYIRTKEGIIVDTTKYKTVVERTFNDKVVAIDLNHWGQDNDKYPTWIDTKNIIKQADTIDELCDEFALISGLNKQANPFLVRLKKEETNIEVIFDDFSRGYLNSKDKLYGAIWTKKGLIYVAKINEKGDLELL